MHIFVVGVFGENEFVVIGQYGLVVAHGGGVEYGQDVVGQEVLVHQLARSPVGDFTAVVGQNEASVLLKLKRLGQGSDAVGRTSGGQYNAYALLLQVQEGVEVSVGYFFL